MKYFSTFTGIGGFEVGLYNAYTKIAGLEDASEAQILSFDSTDNQGTDGRQPPTCVGYSEIDKYASSVYEYHFKGAKNYGDITKIKAEELPDFDLLVGGFPCQAFSIAGKRRGFEDTRGTLFFDLARILREKQPMYGVFENVKGLLSHDKGNTLDVILEELQSIGYYCNWEVYNSKNHGVPQNRERIYLVCQNYRGLTSVGTNTKMTSSEQLIQSYLFQLLLNNLAEVKKLQDHVSKDLILGYLIWKEISQKNHESDLSENIKDGTMTATEESKSPLPGEDHWQSIATWLSSEWGVDLNEPNTSTISTAIKKITHSTTYTFSQMQALIWLATVVLRSSQNNLWNQVLSDLTVIQEGTKYARINHKTQEVIVSESGTVHLPHIDQGEHDGFIIGHSRIESRPKILPIGSNDRTAIGVPGQHTNTLTTRYYGGQANGSYVIESELDAQEIRQLNSPTHSNDRVYASDGISPTLNTMQGGNRQPFIAAQRGRYNADGKTEQKFEPRYDGISSTLTAVQKDNMVVDPPRIRRLTPLECERLQGFPENWTKLGMTWSGTDPELDSYEVSDTQRYKMAGNAVTTNVVQAVFERIFHAL